MPGPFSCQLGPIQQLSYQLGPPRARCKRWTTQWSRYLEIFVPNQYCTCRFHGYMHVAVIRLPAASIFTHLFQTSTSEYQKYSQKKVKPSYREMGGIQWLHGACSHDNTSHPRRKNWSFFVVHSFNVVCTTTIQGNRLFYTHQGIAAAGVLCWNLFQKLLICWMLLT